MEIDNDIDQVEYHHSSFSKKIHRLIKKKKKKKRKKNLTVNNKKGIIFLTEGFGKDVGFSSSRGICPSCGRRFRHQVKVNDRCPLQLQTREEEGGEDTLH